MIVDGIEDDTDASLVECLHHRLELAYAHPWLIRVGGIAALRHIVILRVVAPVELGAMELRLIYRCEVK